MNKYKNNRLYGVITGDLVKSSILSNKQRRTLMTDMNSSFSGRINSLLNNEIVSKISIFRGDSFQSIVKKPEFALHSMILIRCFIKKKYKNKKIKNNLDARISLGIGTIDHYNENNKKRKATEWTGAAFNLSGKALDSLKSKKTKINIVTPWSEVNEEMFVFSKMLDYLISRWSNEQIVAIIGLIGGKSQTDLAKELDITQPAVRKRLITAGSEVIQAILKRYKNIINKNI